MVKKEGLFSTEGVTKSDRSLHTPGSFARQNLLYVQEVGTLKSLQPHRCIREKLDSFLFMLVLSGKGTVECRGKSYEVNAGDCVFLDCMEHYEHISDEADGWELAWVHFNGHGARAYYELFAKHHGGCPVFRAAEPDAYKACILELLDYQQDRGVTAEISCGALLLTLIKQILADVMDAADVADESKTTQMSEVREFLNDNYAESDVLAALAEKYGQSADALDKVFQSLYGIGLEEYVWSRRFNAAKELMRFSVKALDEISCETGFQDTKMMQKQFIEKEGMSAEEYRMKWAQWIK